MTTYKFVVQQQQRSINSFLCMVDTLFKFDTITKKNVFTQIANQVMQVSNNKKSNQIKTCRQGTTNQMIKSLQFSINITIQFEECS